MPGDVLSIEGLRASLGELCNEFKAIVFAPLAQRIFCGNALVFVPCVELARARKQRLELCICAFLAEEPIDRLLMLRKMLFRKAKRKRTTQVELAFLRNSDVQTTVLDIFRKFFVDACAAPVYRAGLSTDIGLTVKCGCLSTAGPLVCSEQFIEAYRYAHMLPSGT